MMESSVHGREALEVLAKRYPQIYVAPADAIDVEGEKVPDQATLEAHRLACARGIAPEGATLAHFTTTEDDELRVVETPAGAVEVLFLKLRADFETFLQVIGHKSQRTPIARTIGAITYRGLADWGKVAAARKSYESEGGTDWLSEFKRLAGQPGTFRSELIVISEGPYSNILATQTPYDEEAWLRISREVRLKHECAHVVCRRTMPDDVLPVWDEVTADVVGLLSAIGRYDVSLASKFLGVSETGFVGGRLGEYLDGEQIARINEVAVEVHSACLRIEHTCTEEDAAKPFEYLLRLKESPYLNY